MRLAFSSSIFAWLMAAANGKAENVMYEVWACDQSNSVANVERRFSVPCSTFETTSIRGTRLNC